ncbi:beta-lactamase superfamily domain-containing protein [Trichoderma breve]|uniref:Protein artemis n=1 Tax=Trichoderma breve TaxID=2034170 RepID=A0A9W9E5S3_9HYPO|nr:beta-lactamase superfamily domain-containing protein [Trichoderma breve]KAJ4855696.1 beta-lactamase superfamily domain-containing protein [Trichoderma breve]
MSTFNGLVSEFPDIRIDFFRHHVDASPPLACFLSHVHSDHLSGLESLRSPFVYCSAATREILLRLERYPCRINYSRGILEARQQTYKHLSKVIKPLPLESPTTIELRPGNCIQVTLFDANHCPGSVMFLIEGQGKAILYTGDTIDTIYLDTSFVDDIPFQTKAEGIAQLLHKVTRYPKDTVFYIQAWTYGYEDVWIALSKALNSPIHVDDYKLRIYNSLNTSSSEMRPSSSAQLTPIAAALTGFMCGNTPQSGCLTSDHNVRLHSCESGNMCPIAKQSSVIRIQPVVASFPDGGVIQEAGIGGGGEDLEREMELGISNQSDLEIFLKIIDALKNTTAEARGECARALTNALASGRDLQLNMSSSTEDTHSTDLQRAMLSIINSQLMAIPARTKVERRSETNLPNVIRFPYSRHSSYAELCNLVNVFKPKDIWPCTFHLETWQNNAMSIKSLFGKYCSGSIFAHDMRINNLVKEMKRHIHEEQNSQGASAQKPLELLASEDDDGTGENESQETNASFTSVLSTHHSSVRCDAYDRMLQNYYGIGWNSIELISVGCNHSVEETEL